MYIILYMYMLRTYIPSLYARACVCMCVIICYMYIIYIKFILKNFFKFYINFIFIIYIRNYN